MYIESGQVTQCFDRVSALVRHAVDQDEISPIYAGSFGWYLTGLSYNEYAQCTQLWSFGEADIDVQLPLCCCTACSEKSGWQKTPYAYVHNCIAGCALEVFDMVPGQSPPRCLKCHGNEISVLPPEELLANELVFRLIQMHPDRDVWIEKMHYLCTLVMNLSGQEQVEDAVGNVASWYDQKTPFLGESRAEDATWKYWDVLWQLSKLYQDPFFDKLIH